MCEIRIVGDTLIIGGVMCVVCEVWCVMWYEGCDSSGVAWGVLPTASRAIVFMYVCMCTCTCTCVRQYVQRLVSTVWSSRDGGHRLSWLRPPPFPLQPLHPLRSCSSTGALHTPAAHDLDKAPLSLALSLSLSAPTPPPPPSHFNTLTPTHTPRHIHTYLHTHSDTYTHTNTQILYLSLFGRSRGFFLTSPVIIYFFCLHVFFVQNSSHKLFAEKWHNYDMTTQISDI